MEEIKRRFWINVCAVAMILIVIIYCSLLLLFSPVMIVGSLFWKWQIFYRISRDYMELIPEIPEVLRLPKPDPNNNQKAQSE